MKFGNSGSKGAASGASMDTLIGRQTEICGDICFSGGLHVDGRVRGKVTAAADQSASLSVSEGGAIEGDVRVPNIVMNGTVNGDVSASVKVRLAAKARVTGNVYYTLIEIESGARVNGQLVHGVPEPVPPPALTDASSATSEFDELSEARRVKGFING